MKHLLILVLFPLLLFSFDLYPPDKTLIQIKTKEMANHGTPFYVLIKPCSFAQFLKDDYYKIVQEKLSDDSQFLGVSCLMPGDTKLIEVKTPEKEALAVYCIFTKPGDEWKYFIDAEGPRKIKILIGDSEIEATSRF